METYALHLAMAALVGASFVAVSAYYMHRRTLTQLLEFAKTVERERDRENGVDDENEAERDDSPQHFRKYVEKRKSHGRRKGNGYYRRASNSLPDVTAIATAGEIDEKPNGLLSIDDRNLSIPAGLPRIRKLPEGMNLSDFSPE